MTDLLWNALRNLLRKPVRTALSVCSLATGVATLTLLGAVSSAGSDAAARELKAMGLGGFSVVAEEGALDEEALRRLSALPQIAVAAPLSVMTTTATLGDREQTVLLCGVDENAGEAIAIDLLSGRLPDSDDVAQQALVCTLEETAAAQAFGGFSSLKNTVTATVAGAEIPFAVIGTARAKSSLLKNLTGNLPPLLLVPYTTLTALSGDETFDRIALHSDESEEALVARIAETLSDKGTFQTDSLSTQKERLTHLLSLITGILTLAGGAAVVVAGFCILTTQLSSVAEQVGEIGLKKALGAKPRHILTEFMLAAALLSLGGGAAGILIGESAAAIGLKIAGIPFRFSLWRIVGLLAGATVFGTGCGLYPAAKAAGLSPCEAFCRS